MFEKFVEEKRQDLLDIFLNSDYDEEALREKVYFQTVALSQLEDWFFSKINTGKLAENNLMEMTK